MANPFDIKQPTRAKATSPQQLPKIDQPSINIFDVKKTLDTKQLVAQTLFGEANFDENEMRAMASVMANRSAKEKADLNSVLAAKDKYGRFEFQGLNNAQATKYRTGSLGGFNEKEKAAMAARIADELVSGKFKPVNQDRFFIHSDGKLKTYDQEGRTIPGNVSNLDEFAKKEEVLKPFLRDVTPEREAEPKKRLEGLDKFLKSVGSGIKNFGRDVLQGLLKSGASVTLTAADKPELSFPEDPELDAVVQKMFGGTPKSIATRIAEGEQKGRELGLGKASLPLSTIVVGGLTALDFTGLGGEKKVFEKLAKEQTVEGITKILKEIKAPSKNIDELIEPLRAAKTPEEVSKVFSGATETVQSGSKISQDILEGSQALRQGAKVEPPLLHGSVGALDGTLPEQEQSVKTLLQALKDAGPIRKAQEAAYSAERAKRIQSAVAVRESVKGEAGLYAELGQLKGELPKEAFDSLRGKVAQKDIDNLFDMVTQNPRLTDFEKINAREGLAKMFGEFGGQVPTQGEIALLNKVFPPEITKELLDKRPFLTKMKEGLVEALNIPRAIQSSFDLSAMGRQGIFMMGRPQRFFQSFIKQFELFGSEKAYQALQASIESRPSYKLMKDSGLSIMEIGGPISTREEQFIASNMVEKIPGIGKLVRRSSRAYTGALNKLRADVFDDMMAKATSQGIDVKNSPDVAKNMAKFINAATGRGTYESVAKIAQPLGAALFSPRLMASRINLLNPSFYANLDPFTRKEALKTLLTTGSMMMTILGLAKASGASVGVDPRSADFAKIKIGNTRYDISGGFQQYFKLAAQLLTGELVSSTTGKVMTLGEGYKPLTRLDIIERFFLSKENPIASFITSALQGQDVVGNEFEVKKEILKRFVPMIAQDLTEAIKEWGVGKGAVMAIPSVFGIGAQTYKQKATGPGGSQSNPFNVK